MRSLVGSRLELALFLELAQFVHALDAVLDGGEVGQQAAQPAVGHVGHAHAVGLFADDVLALLLGAHEQDRAAPAGDVAHEVVRRVEQDGGLLQVDDVDAAPLGEDVGLHLGVPPAGLVAEVDS